MKIQVLIGAIAGLAAVGGAIYQGRLCDRWSLDTPERLQAFTQRLENVPKEIGAWKSTEVPVDEEQFEASNCHGVVSRAYQHSVTGQVVNVFLVSGKGYHVTIHTPDWCYVAAGYEMQNEPVNYEVRCRDLPEDPDFLTTLFYKETSTETNRLRVFWSYSDDGNWTAPKLAKQLFARKPALYKVYLITTIQARPPELGEDPGVLFAQEFMPIINRALFTPEASSTPEELAAR